MRLPKSIDTYLRYRAAELGWIPCVVRYGTRDILACGLPGRPDPIYWTDSAESTQSGWWFHRESGVMTHASFPCSTMGGWYEAAERYAGFRR